MFLVANTPTLSLPDEATVAPMQEPRTSWAILFFDTYFSDNINGDYQAAHHYFDAIFDSVDWNWQEDRNPDLAPMIIEHITRSYLHFEHQLGVMLAPQYRQNRHLYQHVEIREITGDQILVELCFKPEP